MSNLTLTLSPHPKSSQTGRRGAFPERLSSHKGVLACGAAEHKRSEHRGLINQKYKRPCLFFSVGEVIKADFSGQLLNLLALEKV